MNHLQRSQTMIAAVRGTVTSTELCGVTLIMRDEASQHEISWVGYLSAQSGDPAEPAPYWRRVRDRVLGRAGICTGDRVLDIGSGSGLLAFGAADKTGPDGLVIACDMDGNALEMCRKATRSTSPRIEQIHQVQGDARLLPVLSGSMDVAVVRGVLVHLVDKRPVLRELLRVLKRGGRFSCHEPITRRDRRLSELVDLRGLGSLAQDFIAAEQAMWEDPEDPEMNFDECTLADDLRAAGFVRVSSTLERLKKQRHANEAYLHDFWYKQRFPGGKPLYEVLMKHLDRERLDNCVEFINGQLRGKQFTEELAAALIAAMRP